MEGERGVGGGEEVGGDGAGALDLPAEVTDDGGEFGADAGQASPMTRVVLKVEEDVQNYVVDTHILQDNNDESAPRIPHSLPNSAILGLDSALSILEIKGAYGAGKLENIICEEEMRQWRTTI
ncbi:hypothetical protein CR513_25982, partial [Mucuna pruriens]